MHMVELKFFNAMASDVKQCGAGWGKQAITSASIKTLSHCVGHLDLAERGLNRKDAKNAKKGRQVYI
jgi:hypothetical protein